MTDNMGAVLQQLFIEDSGMYAATDGKIFNGVTMDQISLGDKETCVCINATVRATSPWIGTPSAGNARFREQVRIDVISTLNGAYASEVADRVENLLHTATSISYGGSVVQLGQTGEIIRMPSFDSNIMAWRVALTVNLVGAFSVS